MPMERYSLFQEMEAVANLQYIHFGRNQKMLLTESVQDHNLKQTLRTTILRDRIL